MVAPAGLPPCGATRRVHHGRETAPFRARRRPALLDATDDTSVSQEVRVSRHWVCHHAGGGERMASAMASAKSFDPAKGSRLRFH